MEPQPANCQSTAGQITIASSATIEEAPLSRGFLFAVASIRQAATSTGSPDAACLLLDALDMAPAEEGDHDRERREGDDGADAECAMENGHERVHGGRPPAAWVLLVASVESTARPSAPPICCEVLKSPEASP